jgi:hypothetical protein
VDSIKKAATPTVLSSVKTVFVRPEKGEEDTAFEGLV